MQARYDSSTGRNWIIHGRKVKMHVNPEQVHVHFDVSEGKFKRFKANYGIIKGNYEGLSVKYSRILGFIGSWIV